MKIHELINERVDLSKPIPVDMKGRTYLPISGDLVGDGAQAKVFDNDTGQVTKTAAIDPHKGMEDSAVVFAKTAIKNQHNTFFPRIYHAVLFADKENPEAYQNLVVQMERLIPLSEDIIRDSAIRLFKQLGFDGNSSVITGKQSKSSQIDRMTSQTRKVFSGEGGSLKELAKKSKSKDFIEAVSLLTKDTKKFRSDLHPGNWMVRLTPYGPQLVITDPFYPTTIVPSNDESTT